MDTSVVWYALLPPVLISTNANAVASSYRHRYGPVGVRHQGGGKAVVTWKDGYTHTEIAYMQTGIWIAQTKF